jgi:biopolymer transport protein ExbB/TolQ
MLGARMILFGTLAVLLALKGWTLAATAAGIFAALPVLFWWKGKRQRL